MASSSLTRALSLCRSASSFLMSSPPLGPGPPSPRRGGGWAAAWATQMVAPRMAAMINRDVIERILRWFWKKTKGDGLCSQSVKPSRGMDYLNPETSVRLAGDIAQSVVTVQFARRPFLPPYEGGQGGWRSETTLPNPPCPPFVRGGELAWPLIERYWG